MAALYSPIHPLRWLTNKHGATIFAIVIAGAMATMPAPGSAPISLWEAFCCGQYAQGGPALGPSQQVVPAGLPGAWHWLTTYGGKGGLILWPMFGATNQLLGGLAFLVIGFWLWRRSKPVWFLVLPLVFMLIMPAWAMLIQLPTWLDPDQAGGINWPLVVIALATLALEAWMIVEAVLIWPRVRGVVEAGALDDGGAGGPESGVCC